MADYPSLVYPTILAHARRILLAGTCLELRLLRRGPPLIGFFNDPVRFADEITNHDGPEVLGAYYMAAPVHADMLARIDNHLRVATKDDKASALDKDVLFRTSITFDIDPIRTAGISSTDIEHERALFKAHDIAITMSEWYGWPDPDIIDSGNGANLRWWVRMDNTPESLATVKACLARAAATFDDEYVRLDPSVCNASRIFRVPGTVARKGEHMVDRPWRTSAYVSQSGPLDVLTPAALLRFTGKPSDRLSGPSPGGIGGIPSQPRDLKLASLNRKALDRLDEWVPALFPMARQTTQGWDISSESLGRELEERISFTKAGIKDFGVADMGDPMLGARTPVALIAEHLTSGNTDRAADMLAGLLGETISGMGAIFPPPQQPQPTAALYDPNEGLGVRGPMSMDKEHISAFLTNPLDVEVSDPPLAVYDGWVHEGIATFFIALQKTGKSTLMQQIGLCALKGLPIFRTMMPCRRKCDWLLIYAFEDHRSNITRKMELQYRAICREQGIDYSDREYREVNERIALVMPNSPEFRKAVLEGTMPDFQGGDWAESIEILAKALKQKHGPNGMIIIDTFEKMTMFLNGMTQNIVELDMTKTNLLMHKAADLKVPMLVTHHLTKMAGRNDSANVESFAAGTFQFLANIDNYVTMSKPTDKNRMAGITDVAINLQGRMDDMEGSWSELPQLISYSPKVKRVEDGGFIFRATARLPDDPTALDDDQEKVYNAILSKLNNYMSVNKLEALTGLSNRKTHRAALALVEKDKIIEIAINTRETGYCIEDSIGHIEAKTKAGISLGDRPTPRLPKVL